MSLLLLCFVAAPTPHLPMSQIAKFQELLNSGITPDMVLQVLSVMNPAGVYQSSLRRSQHGLSMRSWWIACKSLSDMALFPFSSHHRGTPPRTHHDPRSTLTLIPAPPVSCPLLPRAGHLLTSCC